VVVASKDPTSRLDRNEPYNIAMLAHPGFRYPLPDMAASSTSSTCSVMAS
jgi:hypothetical protein